MQYINSDKITVFPSAFRGSPYYKSRLTSEENLTLLGKYSRSGSAVIKDGNYTIIVLEGYVFKMLTADVPKGNNLFAIIYIEEKNFIKRLSKVPKTDNKAEGDETLDGDDPGNPSIFHGLAFGTQAEGNDHTASVQVRDASGDIFYTKEDGSSKTYDANLAVVTDASGYLTTKSLYASKNTDKGSALGFIDRVSILQNDLGQITSLTASFATPSPKDLTSTGYATGRILGINSAGALVWRAPGTSSGANDGNFTVNGTKIWSANSSTPGGLSFNTDHFITTYSNGVASIKLKNGGGGSAVTPNNGELQINGNVIFSADQSDNTNIILDPNYFTYADQRVGLKLDAIQSEVSENIGDALLSINGNKIFTANQKGSGSDITLDEASFVYNTSDRSIHLKEGLINAGTLSINDIQVFDANTATDEHINLSSKYFTFKQSPTDHYFTLGFTDSPAFSTLSVEGAVNAQTLALKASGSSEKFNATNKSLKVGSTGGELRVGEAFYVRTATGLASAYTYWGNAETLNANNYYVDINVQNQGSVGNATIKVIGTREIFAKVEPVGVYINNDGIRLKGNTYMGTAGGSFDTTINMSVDGGTITCIGNITAAAFNQRSDARLKENLKPFFESKKSILNLPIYTYNFIGRGERFLGCLAQDLQEICPEIVNENADGYLSIQESKIVYLLLEEVKKLRTELDIVKMKQEIR